LPEVPARPLLLRSWKKPVEWPSRIDVVQAERNGEVVVELYAGRVDMSRELAEGESIALTGNGAGPGSELRYREFEQLAYVLAAESED
jgi:hypothetical protein